MSERKLRALNPMRFSASQLRLFLRFRVSIHMHDFFYKIPAMTDIYMDKCFLCFKSCTSTFSFPLNIVDKGLAR